MPVLDAILPVFCVILLGFYLRRHGKLPEEATKPLLEITYRWAYPAFILAKMANDPGLHQPGNVIWPAVAGVGFMVLGIGLGWMVAPWLGLRERPSRAAFAVAVSIQNYGFIPLPLLEILFPKESWAGVLFVYTLGLELVLWTLGVMVMSGKFRSPWKRLLSPMVLSILFGILLVVTGLDRWLPKWLLETLRLLGQTSFPLGILLFGATLSDVTRLSGWYKDWKTPLGAVVLRMALLPLGLLLFAKAVSPSTAFNHVMAVQAAMPAAVFPLILARMEGADDIVAARVIVFTSLVSLFTIPVVLPWAIRFLSF